MEKFTVYKGLVAPLNRENVDTDAIIPKQFLKPIKKTGFGQNLFDEWRYLDHGEPGQDCSTRLRLIQILSSISLVIKAQAFCWRVRTLVVAAPVSMRHGHWTNIDLERLSLQALQIFFITTASKMAFYPLF
jgi:hypothetical protein